MIVEATYTGPFARVEVPNSGGKVCKRDETVKIRVHDGVPLGGCWEITKGKKEYEAALKKREAEVAKARAEKARRGDATLAKAQARVDDATTKAATTKSGKKGGAK